MRWTFGVEPLRRPSSSPRLAAPAHRPRAVARRRRAPRSTALIATLREAEADARPTRCPPIPAPRVGADRRRRRSRLPRPRARHRRVQPVLPGVRDHASTATAATGTVDVPDRLRGPAGHRPRRLPRRVLRLVIQHHNCDVGVAGKTTSLDAALPAADAAAHRRCTSRSSARRRRTTASTRPPGCCDGDERAVRGARWRRSPATGRACPRSRPAGPARDRRPSIDAGDDLPAHRPRAAPRAGRRARRRGRSWSCDDDGSDLRRGRRRGRPRWPAACSPPAPARARTSASSTRTAATSSWPGWPPPASARSRVPLSTFSTSAELRGLLRNADVELLLSAPSYRSHDYVDDAARRRSPSSTSAGPPPLLAPSVPVAASHRLRRRRPPDVDPDWSDAALLDGRGPVDRATTCSRAAEADVSAGRPHGHRAHLGLDQRARRA